MKHIIVLHDAFVNPTDYWYPNIQSIAPVGYTVITPELPSGSEQGFLYWIKVLEQYKDIVNTDTIIISHGISSLLALRYIESLSEPIRNYISIAGTVDVPAHKALSPIAKTFIVEPFNWLLIKKNISGPVHIWNQKDPFINPQLSLQFAEVLSGISKPLQGIGHFTETTEPELFSVLDEIFKNVTAEDKEKEFLLSIKTEQERKEAIVQASIPAVVTYDTDVAKSIAGYQGRVISELLTEAREREKEVKQASPANPKNVFYIAASIILIVAGIGALTYTSISQMPKLAQLIQSPTKKYENILLRVENISPFEINSTEQFITVKQFNALQDKDVAARSFYSIVPTKGGAKIDLQSFGDAVGLKLPVGFSAQTDNYLVGYYRPESGEKIPFLLIHFEGYDIMYQLMHRWETNNIVGDTLALFSPGKIATTLVKSEVPNFLDQTINNIVIRNARLADEKEITYTFLTNDTLMITTNSTAIQPVLRRMLGR